MYILFFCIFLLVCLILYPLAEGYSNISENIGNHLAAYFYNYTLSILEKRDFEYSKTESDFLKYLPTHISFNSAIADQFEKKNITLEKLRAILNVGLWECNSDVNMDLFHILKPTIHAILDKAFIQSGLNRRPISTVIHFRCADTPFVKQPNYYLQRYSFFKKALEKIDPSDKTVTLMNCSTHLSKKEEQDACALYVTHLSDYLKSIGYDVKLRCNTNVEDFADLFYAKAVISTGGSYSFMSGFFGNGQFISTEHMIDGNTCTTKECDDIFIRGHNIFHPEVDSYYEVDKVHPLLSVPFSAE